LSSFSTASAAHRPLPSFPTRRSSDLGEGGRVVHIGAVLGPSNVPDMGKWTDLTMLTFLPGRERTEAEFEGLYQAAGFEMTMVLRIAGNWGIVEGTAT